MFTSQYFQNLCTGEDDRSEVAGANITPKTTVKSARNSSVWDRNLSFQSAATNSIGLGGQQQMAMAAHGHHTSVGSNFPGRHHSSIGSMPGQLDHRTSVIAAARHRPMKPMRPAAQVDREKMSYSVDMLEYLCSYVEQLGGTLEDLHQRTSTISPGLSSVEARRMSVGTHAGAHNSTLHSKHSSQRLLGTNGLSQSGHTAHQVGPNEVSRHTASYTSNLASGSSMAGGSSAPYSKGQLSAQHQASKSSSGDDESSFAGRASTRVVDKQWPASIEIRGGLEQSGNAVSKDKVRSMMVKALKSERTKNPRHGKLWKGQHDSGFLSKVCSMKDPNAKFVRIVDMASCFALVNDCLVTPYTLAWNMQTTLTLQCIALFSALYWTFFMLLKFRTGFYEDGELKMGQWEIVKRYFRTTFILDIILTSLDWSVLFVPASQTGPNVRMIKLIRTMKIFRLARVWELVESLVDSYAPEGTSSKLIIRLAQVMISTTIFSHIMSCAWFSFGTDGRSDTGQRWFEMFIAKSEQDRFLTDGIEDKFEASPLYQYVTSFHWTLAQLTLNSVDIHPVNSIERMFNVALQFAGIVFNATIVSLISSQAVEFIANRRDQINKLQTLKRFLEQHRVDTKLAVRVQRQVMDRIRSADALIAEDDVLALSMMSSQLKSQLLYETRLPHMLGHMLFRVWWETDEAALRELSENALCFEIYKAYDCLFIPGELAEGMMRVAEGQLRYTQDAETSREADDTEFIINRGASICEAGLWSEWIHVGKCECLRSCSLLGISAADLIQSLSHFPLIGHITRQYGRAYHLRITCARPPFSRWPNDVEVPHTNASDLLEQDIGLELLRRERENASSPLANMPEDDYLELVAEVEKEKCAIEANLDGTLDRIVALVTVKVCRDEDSRILAEVGKYDKKKSEAKASCALPGTKRPRGELPHQTYDRLLKTDLKFIAAGIRTHSCETQVEVKESQHFGLLTKYLRTVQNAHLNPDYEWPDMPSLMQALPRSEPSVAPASPGGSKKNLARQGTRRMSMASAEVFKSEDKPPQDKDEAAVEDLSEEPVYLVEDNGKVRMYCWLYEHTFNFFRSNSGKTLLERWVASMDIASALLPPSMSQSYSLQAIAINSSTESLSLQASAGPVNGGTAPSTRQSLDQGSPIGDDNANVPAIPVQSTDMPRMRTPPPESTTLSSPKRYARELSL